MKTTKQIVQQRLTVQPPVIVTPILSEELRPQGNAVSAAKPSTPTKQIQIRTVESIEANLNSIELMLDCLFKDTNIQKKNTKQYNSQEFSISQMEHSAFSHCQSRIDIEPEFMRYDLNRVHTLFQHQAKKTEISCRFVVIENEGKPQLLLSQGTDREGMSHAQLACGEETLSWCFSAGEIMFRKDGQQWFITEISNKTGHFKCHFESLLSPLCIFLDEASQYLGETINLIQHKSNNNENKIPVSVQQLSDLYKQKIAGPQIQFAEEEEDDDGAHASPARAGRSSRALHESHQEVRTLFSVSHLQDGGCWMGDAAPARVAARSSSESPQENDRTYSLFTGRQQLQFAADDDAHASPARANRASRSLHKSHQEVRSLFSVPEERWMGDAAPARATAHSLSESSQENELSYSLLTGKPLLQFAEDDDAHASPARANRASRSLHESHQEARTLFSVPGECWMGDVAPARAPARSSSSESSQENDRSHSLFFSSSRANAHNITSRTSNTSSQKSDSVQVGLFAGSLSSKEDNSEHSDEGHELNFHH